MTKTKEAFLRWFKTTYEFNKFDMDDVTGLLMQKAFQAGMEYAEMMNGRDNPRAAKAAAVMPKIAPMLVEFEDLDCHFSEVFERDANELFCILHRINLAMEDVE